MMANWGTIMFLLFVIPLSWFIEVMAKGHHHVPSLRHSIIVVHRGEMSMMANWGTIMFLLLVIPLSWFIEVRMAMMANWGTIMFLLLVIPLSWFIEV
jgi:hypothetical protein